MHSENDDKFVELTQIVDPIEADLLAAFLEDGGVQFQLLNRMNARIMGPLMPGAQNPVVIAVREADQEAARSLLAEYREMQKISNPPSIPPEEYQDNPVNPTADDDNE